MVNELQEKELIKDKEDYLKLFQNIEDINYQSNKQYEALKLALDIRKFEIEMYWKRATYFWAFIAATFAGYFAIISSENPNIEHYHILMITVLGFFFSYSWYLVNRGSKFWQKNWEKHVDYLEIELIGPLYETVINPKNCHILNLFDEYPFSVSKLNQLLSFIITFAWLVIIYKTLADIYPETEKLCLISIETAVFFSISILYFIFGRSAISKVKNINKDEKFILRRIDK